LKKGCWEAGMPGGLKAGKVRIREGERVRKGEAE